MRNLELLAVASLVLIAVYTGHYVTMQGQLDVSCFAPIELP